MPWWAMPTNEWSRCYAPNLRSHHETFRHHRLNRQAAGPHRRPPQGHRRTEYDSRNGRPVNDGLADYPVCTNADVGSIDAIFIDKPDPQINSLGCRGIGEIGITGVAAAVANAVHHATGKRIRELPITPDKLL